MLLLLIMSLVAVWAVWVAYEVNKEGGYPPYQDSMNRCNQDCRQGRDCDCYQRSCDMNVEEYDKQWPFPRNKP